VSGTTNDELNFLMGTSGNNQSYVDPTTGQIIGQSTDPAIGEGE